MYSNNLLGLDCSGNSKKQDGHNFSYCLFHQKPVTDLVQKYFLVKRPLRDAFLCMGDLQAPPAPHFVFLITL